MQPVSQSDNWLNRDRQTHVSKEECACFGIALMSVFTHENHGMTHTQIESVGPASCHVTCHVIFVYIEAMRVKTSAAVIGLAPNLCRFPITNEDISTGCGLFGCFLVVYGDAIVLFTTYDTEWNDRTYNNKPFTQ